MTIPIPAPRLGSGAGLRFAAAGGLAAALIVSGCVLSPKPDPSRHYVLRSVAADRGTGAIVAGRSGLVLGVGPIVLPDYLKRSEIVTSLGGGQVEVRDFFLWAEDLDSGMAQSLSSSIGHYTGSTKVAPFPEVDLGTAVPKVAVLVRRFEPTTAGEVLLAGHWVVVEPGREIGDFKGTPFEIRVAVEAPADAPTPERIEAAVAAMSEALDRLAREIVRGL